MNKSKIKAHYWPLNTSIANLGDLVESLKSKGIQPEDFKKITIEVDPYEEDHQLVVWIPDIQ